MKEFELILHVELLLIFPFHVLSGMRSRNIVVKYTGGTKLGDVVNIEMDYTVEPQKKKP